MSESKWVERNLGDLGKFSTSSVDKKSVPGQDRVKLINYMDVYRHSTINKKIDFMEVTASKKECASSIVKTGDILFVPSSETPEDICHAAVVGEPLEATLHSYHTVRFRPHSDDIFDLRFSAWLAQSQKVEEQLRRKCSGSTRYTLTIPSFKSTEVFFPKSLVVQHKIAKVLDAVELAIEQTEELIEKYSLVKAGMMHDLFTRGLTTDGKLRLPREEAPDLYKDTSIGWIPKEWKDDLLDKSADRRSGHTPSKSFPEYWNGEVKWVSLADSYRLDRLYINDTDFEISKLGLQNSSAVLLPAGTVIMSRDAGIGKSAITTEPMAVSQHFMAWQCGDKMDKYFLYYWLQHKKRMFENIAMGSTILTIGLSYFKRLRIAAPGDLNEQEQIGKRLKQADIHIFALKAELTKLRKQKSGLTHDLLTGKVQVKVKDLEAAHV